MKKALLKKRDFTSKGWDIFVLLFNLEKSKHTIDSIEMQVDITKINYNFTCVHCNYMFYSPEVRTCPKCGSSGVKISTGE